MYCIKKHYWSLPLERKGTLKKTGKKNTGNSENIQTRKTSWELNSVTIELKHGLTLAERDSDWHFDIKSDHEENLVEMKELQYSFENMEGKHCSSSSSEYFWGYLWIKASFLVPTLGRMGMNPFPHTVGQNLAKKQARRTEVHTRGKQKLSFRSGK